MLKKTIFAFLLLTNTAFAAPSGYIDIEIFGMAIISKQNATHVQFNMKGEYESPVSNEKINVAGCQLFTVCTAAADTNRATCLPKFIHCNEGHILHGPVGGQIITDKHGMHTTALMTNDFEPDVSIATDIRLMFYPMAPNGDEPEMQINFDPTAIEAENIQRVKKGPIDGTPQK